MSCQSNINISSCHTAQGLSTVNVSQVQEIYTDHCIKEWECCQVEESLPGLIAHRVIHMVEFVDNVISQVSVG